jgi:hypothetical protein
VRGFDHERRFLAPASEGSAADGELGNDIGVMLGKGDGKFQAPVSYPVGPMSWFRGGAARRGVVVADFNGDGIPDPAVLFLGGVRVLLGNGDGSFQTTAISYVTGPDQLAVGDFNGDGLPDLAVSSDGFNQVSVLLNDGKWDRNSLSLPGG